MSKLGAIDNVAKAGVKTGQSLSKGAAKALSGPALQKLTPTPPPSIAQPPGANMSPASRDFARFQRAKQVGFEGANYKPPAKMTDTAHEIFMSSTLGNLHTPWLNQFSNTINAIMAPMDTASKAFLTMFKSKEDRVAASEVAAHVYGMFEGFSQSLAFTGQRLKNLPRGTETRADTLAKMRITQGLLNTDKLEQRQRVITAQNYGIDPTTMFGKAVSGIGAVINVPTGILNYQDLMFKMVHQRGTLRTWAQRQVNQGKFGTTDEALEAAVRDPKLAKLAVQDAEYYTFMNRAKMPMLSWITDVSVEKLPGMRWIVPFRRTIANVLEQGIERSPLVLASPTLRKRLYHPNFDIRLDAQAKLLTGLTTLTAMAAMLDDEEGLMLVGQGPRDAFNAAQWESVNGPPNSLTYRKGPKEEHWSIRLDDLGPMGFILKTVANYKQWLAGMPQERLDAIKDSGEYNEILKEAGAFVAPIFEAGYSTWWGRDVSEFFSAIETMRKHDGDLTPVVRWTEQIAARLVPVMGTGYNKAVVEQLDPTTREYRQAGDYFKQLTAETSKLLRPRYDDFGREVVRNSFRKPGSEFPENPYDPTDPVATEMVAAGLDLRPLSDFIRAESAEIPGTQGPLAAGNNKQNGEKVKFSDAEYAELQRRKREGFMHLMPYRDYMRLAVDNPAIKESSKIQRHAALSEWREQYHRQLLETAKLTMPDFRMRYEEANLKNKLNVANGLFNREGQQ